MKKTDSRSPSFFVWQAIVRAGVVVVISLIAAQYINIYLPNELLERGVSTTSAFVTSISTIYAIVAGFTILIAFDRFKTLTGGVDQELATLGDLLDLTQYFGEHSQEAQEIRKKIYAYAGSIAQDEWVTMKEGKANPKTTEYLRQLMQSTNTIPMGQTKDALLWEAFIVRMTNLTTLRVSRIAGASKSLPSLLTVALKVISIVAIFSVIILPFPHLFTQRLLVASIVFILILIQSFIGDIGKPFSAGLWQISKEDFINVKTSILSSNS